MKVTVIDQGGGDFAAQGTADTSKPFRIKAVEFRLFH